MSIATTGSDTSPDNSGTVLTRVNPRGSTRWATWGLRVWHRDFFDAEIVACPDASVVGKSFGQVGQERGRPGEGALHPVDAFVDLVLEHGTALRWRTTISNHRPELLKKIAGRLRVGDRADVVILDPAALDDRLDDYHESPVEQFGGLSRVVNRNDECVTRVLISGRTVVADGVPTPLLGTERAGSFLRVGQKVAPRTTSPVLVE